MGEKMKRDWTGNYNSIFKTIGASLGVKNMKSYKKKYKLKIKRIYIELYPPDEDIKNKLNELKEPTATYIKRLIRQDLKRSE